MVQGIDLDFVTIGNAGNATDSTGYGAVGYEYQIGTYEITASQWSTINTATGIGDAGYWSGNQPMSVRQGSGNMSRGNMCPDRKKLNSI